MTRPLTVPPSLYPNPEFIPDHGLAVAVNAALDQQSPQAWGNLARACNTRLMTPEALEVAEEAQRRWPDDVQLWHERLIAASLDPDLLKPLVQELGRRMQRGVTLRSLMPANLAYGLILLGRDREASVLLEERARALAGEPLYHEVRGYWLQARRDWDGAREAFEESLRIVPDNPRACRLVGECLASAGDLSGARVWDERAVRLDPGFLRAWNSLGKNHLQAGDLLRATQCFAIAQHINPRDWDVNFTLADHYLEQGEYGRATAECRKILDLQPDDRIAAEALNFLGYLAFREGNLAEAETRYRAALEKDPNFGLAWSNSGDLAMARRDWMAAIDCYQRALREDPGLADARIQLGFALLEIGRPDEAEVLFLHALEGLPNEPAARLGLAEVYRRRKRHDLQLGESLRALETAPDDPEVHHQVAIAYDALGKSAKARTHYERTLKLNPMHRWGANNLAYLLTREYEARKDAASLRRAMQAWKRRLLICRETGASTRGAERHLRDLGMKATEIRRIMKEETYPWA